MPLVFAPLGEHVEQSSGGSVDTCLSGPPERSIAGTLLAYELATEASSAGTPAF
jgi:hypothetical protein